MTDPERIRISDADRERFADRLRTAYAEGRITEVELEERLRTVFQARFETEAEGATADLPVPVEQPVVTQPFPGQDHVDSLGRAVRSAVQWYFPALICTVIWALTSFGGYFWPIWVFLGLTIPFVSSLVFDRDPDPEIDVKQADRRGLDES